MALLALLCAASALGSASSWRISFEPQPVVFNKADPEKSVSVLLKNVSNHEAWVWESNAVADYDLSLTDVQGKSILMTAKGLYALERLRSVFLRTLREKIPVNSVYKNHIELSYFYDLPPGHYVFQVRLQTINQDNFDWEVKKPIPQQAQDVPAGSTPIEIKP